MMVVMVVVVVVVGVGVGVPVVTFVVHVIMAVPLIGFLVVSRSSQVFELLSPDVGKDGD